MPPESGPLSGYGIFVKEMHEALKKGPGGLSFSQRAVIISTVWLGMNASDRDIFNTAAAIVGATAGIRPVVRDQFPLPLARPP
jgi:hypothetical protein